MDSKPKTKGSRILTLFANTSIPTKGLVLVAFPLLLQILFLAGFVGLRAKLAEDRAWNEHSNRVLDVASDAKIGTSVSFNRTLVFVLDESAVQQTEIEQRIASADETLGKLESLTVDNPTAFEEVKVLRSLFANFKQQMENIVRISATLRNGEEAGREALVSELSTLLKQTARTGIQIRESFDRFLTNERQIAARRSSRVDHSMTAILWLFCAAAIAMIVGAYGLHKFFKEFFLKRFRVVLENLEIIADGGKLPPPLEGSDEIAQIDRAIHTLSRDLSEKEEDAEIFLYSVSHDLRSPLVNIHGFSEELRHGLTDVRNHLTSDNQSADGTKRVLSIVDKDLSESLRFIKAGVDRMANIIESLLRLSRAWRTDYRREKVSLNEVAQKVIDSLAGSISDKKAVVELKELPTVIGDRGSLEQVVQNLLTNSLKFSRLDRDSRIEIGTLEEDNESATIYVKDNGLGIPADAIPKLFVGFRRFHPTAAPGDGIGLAVCRRVIQRHQGEIWCESSTEADSGSTFFITLPLWTNAQVEDPSQLRVNA